ncbi:ImmA/IrrE family metallo-endopeptidase [Kribbella sp. NPDC051952]|uniref:ImmA/IrrE family metallo-endopeptidase n=1 Tax=Kribbella sp. NPDC051952 TaxID=3154851 RepID=UPI003430DD50
MDVRSTGDGSEGFTDYDAKIIVVADHLDDFTAIARLAHEVGHMRLHSAPDGIGAGSEMCRGTREVEAESVAYIVLAHHGLSIETSSFDYVAGWAALVDPEDPGSVIKATGSRVVNAARPLIGSTDTYLKANRTQLPAVPARSIDSLFLAPELDGPAL